MCHRRWSAYGQAARQRKKEKFTALFHHLDAAMLRTAFFALKKDAAPGVDGLTWEAYEADLDRRIEDLHARLSHGEHIGRSHPGGGYIPKADGSTAPACGRRSRRQDRPESDGGGAERDLRGRLPRVLVWVPAESAASMMRWMR